MTTPPTASDGPCGAAAQGSGEHQPVSSDKPSVQPHRLRRAMATVLAATVLITGTAAIASARTVPSADAVDTVPEVDRRDDPLRG